MAKRPIHIYFAAPLFTQAEWRWNAQVVCELRRLDFEVTLPQEIAQRMLTGEEPFDARALFMANILGIEQADILVAVFDGADPDSGACWECGYAYKLGRPVMGIRTDLRGGGEDPEAHVNLMLSQSCEKILVVPQGKRDDIPWLTNEVAQTIRTRKTIGNRPARKNKAAI